MLSLAQQNTMWSGCHDILTHLLLICNHSKITWICYTECEFVRLYSKAKRWLTKSAGSVWSPCSTNWEAVSSLAPVMTGSHDMFPSYTFRIMPVIVETLRGCLYSALHRRKPSQLASRVVIIWTHTVRKVIVFHMQF